MYAVVYQVDMKPNWAGDVDAELDQLIEAVKSAPGFVHGTWVNDGKTGLSLIVMENEGAAKEMASNRAIPPEAGVTFRSVDIYEVSRDV